MSNSCHYKNLVEEFAEPRFNEVPRDWENLFVISRLRYIKSFELTTFWENKQNVRYIEVQLTINCVIVAQEPSKFWLQAHYRTPNCKSSTFWTFLPLRKSAIDINEAKDLQDEEWFLLANQTVNNFISKFKRCSLTDPYNFAFSRRNYQKHLLPAFDEFDRTTPGS